MVAFTSAKETGTLKTRHTHFPVLGGAFCTLDGTQCRQGTVLHLQVGQATDAEQKEGRFDPSASIREVGEKELGKSMQQSASVRPNPRLRGGARNDRAGKDEAAMG